MCFVDMRFVNYVSRRFSFVLLLPTVISLSFDLQWSNVKFKALRKPVLTFNAIIVFSRKKKRKKMSNLGNVNKKKKMVNHSKKCTFFFLLSSVILVAASKFNVKLCEFEINDI